MHIDRYVKIILTVIAVELLWIGLKDGATPVVAQAQRAPTPVVITGIELSGPEAGFLPVAVVGSYRRIPAASRDAVDRLTAEITADRADQGRDRTAARRDRAGHGARDGGAPVARRERALHAVEGPRRVGRSAGQGRDGERADRPVFPLRSRHALQGPDVLARRGGSGGAGTHAAARPDRLARSPGTRPRASPGALRLPAGTRRAGRSPRERGGSAGDGGAGRRGGAARRRNRPPSSWVWPRPATCSSAARPTTTSRANSPNPPDYAEKLALGRCLFTVASSDQAISLSEESEIHRIVNQLKILPQDLIKLRLLHGRFLPGRGTGDCRRKSFPPSSR